MKEDYDIKLEFNVDELLLMLSKYYSKVLGKEIKVQEEHDLKYNYSGFGYFEERKPCVSIKLFYVENMIINGVNTKITTTINDYNIRLALNDFLETTDYELESFEFNDIVKKDWNYEIPSAYFTGMTVYLNVKGLNKKLILG